MLNQLKTVALLGVLSAIFVAIGGYLGEIYLLLFGVLAVGMSFGAYFWSDTIVLRLQRAAEISPHLEPRLHRMVEELAARAGIPKPRVYLLPEQQANAFATGRDPRHAAVAVTQGILTLLNERELRGVLAHELAHIKNRDILIATIAAAIATAITYVANALQLATIFGGAGGDDEEHSPGSGFLFALVAPVGALLIQLGISRAREYQADATGAEIAGEPHGLASALEKLHYGAARVPAHAVQPASASLYIVNPLHGGSLTSLFSTHPRVEDRVDRLRRMGGPRPGVWAA